VWTSEHYPWALYHPRLLRRVSNAYVRHPFCPRTTCFCASRHHLVTYVCATPIAIALSLPVHTYPRYAALSAPLPPAFVPPAGRGNVAGPPNPSGGLWSMIFSLFVWTWIKFPEINPSDQHIWYTTSNILQTPMTR
jgi:hypothetical protein